MRKRRKEEEETKGMEGSEGDLLIQKLHSLEKDWEAFKRSSKSRPRTQTRRTSASIDNDLFRHLDNSPRNLMSSLQKNISRRSSPNLAAVPCKGRRLLFDSREVVSDDDVQDNLVRDQELEVKSSVSSRYDENADIGVLSSISCRCCQCVCSCSSSVKQERGGGGEDAGGVGGGRSNRNNRWMFSMGRLAIALTVLTLGLLISLGCKMIIEDDHVFLCPT